MFPFLRDVDDMGLEESRLMQTSSHWPTRNVKATTARSHP